MANVGKSWSHGVEVVSCVNSIDVSSTNVSHGHMHVMPIDHKITDWG